MYKKTVTEDITIRCDLCWNTNEYSYTNSELKFKSEDFRFLHLGVASEMEGTGKARWFKVCTECAERLKNGYGASPEFKEWVFERVEQLRSVLADEDDTEVHDAEATSGTSD